MKFKCKHILLSYDKAENSSHNRPLGVAMSEAEQLVLDLKKGSIISADDLAFKKPGTGIAPGQYKGFVKLRLKVGILKDQLITWEHVK